MADPKYSEHTYGGGEELSYPFTSRSDADKKRPTSTAYTALDDSYDPTNIGNPRTYTENADPTYYNDKRASSARALSYSDDGLIQEQTIDESPVAPLVRDISNKHNEPYQDLGVFQ